MKRWDDFLKEQPSREHTAAVEAAVFAEIEKARDGRRWWLKLVAVSLGAAAMFAGVALVQRSEEGDDPDAAGMLELADADEDLNLDTMEDLDVIEILEDLEQWQNG